ncbi:MAG: phosphotransferase [Erythrobacter sp.]|jgi:aminoglycoside/choline kinase family phosphotransferase|uniref:aminoglycoside phosphotransferase family protein n=1 Tax=Qipengyuania citrea TaxID=225971 RepID=UPI00209CF369|nr:phosphotransferase [Qipengyuania citrea]MCP2016722.1 aminoglycoside/choline kinase family phosphotransferase [Qipengyuania citrea]MDE0900821.1 phosphotransferase [Erythrobacter sp.]
MSDALLDDIHAFLGDTEWEGAEITPLVGDASFRRYFRLKLGGKSAMLMHAPPPEEDPKPFLHVAHWLETSGLRAPHILLEDAARGWVLTEDFGDQRMREWIDDNPGDERDIYAKAIDTLVQLHRLPPGPFATYDMAVYLREAMLLVEWYCPAMGLDVDVEGYRKAWEAVLEPLLPRQTPGVTVLRDYHAENIMLLEPGKLAGAQGLIDFQDALVGHPAYDLVSLLQDARRDVAEDLECEMLGRYRAAADPGEHFEADYARLGAQRNAKIVGIFTRLWKRDGKARYLAMIPRVWTAMERDLAHEALRPVADWFAANIPQEIRDTAGGEIQ